MIHQIHGLVWGPALLTLLLASGIFFSVKFRWFQIWGIRRWMGETVGSLLTGGKESGERGEHAGVSAVQSACTALAATIGTGNIVGVATALTAGGPGAIFWMWVSAAIGMMTAYAETSLGIQFRCRNKDGIWICGPVAYLSRGLGKNGLAVIYGILCLMASLGMGSMVQSNAAAQTICYLTGAPPLWCAAVITILVVLVIGGGTARVVQVTEKLIPVSAGIYIIFSAAVLFLCRRQILPAMSEILKCALLPEAVLGGVGGYGIVRSFRYGVARGVFSNEAGLGSLAGLHGSTEHGVPQEQGMWAMFEVFFDTIVICTMTALVILCVVGGRKELAACSLDGAVLTSFCFQACIGHMGQYLISGAMVAFAFATTIAWYFLGRQTLEGVVEQIKSWIDLPEEAVRWAGRLYLILFGYAVFLGCVSTLTEVWELSDIWNGLMALPNIYGLFCLHRWIPAPTGEK